MTTDADLPARQGDSTADARALQRDRARGDLAASHPEANERARTLSSTSSPPRKVERRQQRQHNSTVSQHDRAALLALVRFRILSFGQLRRAAFPTLTPQRVGQRLAALAASGWVRIWEDVSVRGGHPRYALPTRRSLALAIDCLRAESRGHPHEQLAALMLRHAARRPLVLAPRRTPAFLAHQRECNDLLLAYGGCLGSRIRWASSLDRPLPASARGIVLPQPDYVLLLDQSGEPALIFGEHDRGQESLAHFRRAKAERYAALAARPELVVELFGISRFMVWVTVLDVRAGAPLRRLAKLARIAHEAAASDVLAFTLAGWAVSSPAEAIWFCDGAMPDGEELGIAKDSPLLRQLPLHPPQSS